MPLTCEVEQRDCVIETWRLQLQAIDNESGDTNSKRKLQFAHDFRNVGRRFLRVRRVTDCHANAFYSGSDNFDRKWKQVDVDRDRRPLGRHIKTVVAVGDAL